MASKLKRDGTRAFRRLEDAIARSCCDPSTFFAHALNEPSDPAVLYKQADTEARKFRSAQRRSNEGDAPYVVPWWASAFVDEVLGKKCPRAYIKSRPLLPARQTDDLKMVA